jgi:hypothetical protein
MNTAQRWISLVAVVALVVSTLFPPYCSSGEKPHRFGYHFIGCPPAAESAPLPPETSTAGPTEHSGGTLSHFDFFAEQDWTVDGQRVRGFPEIRLDWWRLCIQYVGILAICGAAFVIFDRDPRRFLPGSKTLKE